MDKEEIRLAIVQLRAPLLRFARLQLRSDMLAEDVVQEALLAACEGVSRFSGASSLKTWVFSILRNKIIDVFRDQKRAPLVSTGETEDGGTLLDETLFDQREHWQVMPSAWGDPEMALEQKRFWQIFEACLDGVPPAPARAFMMREFLGMETQEICKEMRISTSNCWVLLHRARLALRTCLDQRWFGELGAE